MPVRLWNVRIGAPVSARPQIGEFIMNEYFVGVDVSKDKLDVAVLPDGGRWSVGNNEEGIAATLIVLEATGGLEDPCDGVHQFGWPTCRCSESTPGQGFCQGHRKACEDRRYRCRVVGPLCAKDTPEPRPIKGEAQQEFSAPLARRAQLRSTCSWRRRTVFSPRPRPSERI